MQLAEWAPNIPPHQPPAQQTGQSKITISKFYLQNFVLLTFFFWKSHAAKVRKLFSWVDRNPSVWSPFITLSLRAGRLNDCKCFSASQIMELKGLVSNTWKGCKESAKAAPWACTACFPQPVSSHSPYVLLFSLSSSEGIYNCWGFFVGLFFFFLLCLDFR